MDMNKHTQKLMQFSPQTLQNRVATLQAEQARMRESLPAQLFAVASVILSLFAVGQNFGYSSLAFVLPAFCFVVFGGVMAFGAWGLRSNLNDSIAALKHLAS